MLTQTQIYECLEYGRREHIHPNKLLVGIKYDGTHAIILAPIDDEPPGWYFLYVFNGAYFCGTYKYHSRINKLWHLCGRSRSVICPSECIAAIAEFMQRPNMPKCTKPAFSSAPL